MMTHLHIVVSGLRGGGVLYCARSRGSGRTPLRTPLWLDLSRRSSSGTRTVEALGTTTDSRTSSCPGASSQTCMETRQLSEGEGERGRPGRGWGGGVINRGTDTGAHGSEAVPIMPESASIKTILWKLAKYQLTQTGAFNYFIVTLHPKLHLTSKKCSLCARPKQSLNCKLLRSLRNQDGRGERGGGPGTGRPDLPPQQLAPSCQGTA